MQATRLVWRLLFMPDLHPDEVGPPEHRLQGFLADHFPAPDGTILSVADAPHPLLLLRFHRDLAGFALSNGDHPRRCFDHSYSFFKDLYAKNQHEWNALNLTFVF